MQNLDDDLSTQGITVINLNNTFFLSTVSKFDTGAYIDNAMFSPDSKLILCNHANFITNVNFISLWVTETGIVVHRLHGHTQVIHKCLFLSDNAIIISTSSAETIVWNSMTGENIRILSHTGDTNIWGRQIPNLISIDSYLSRNQTVVLVQGSWQGQMLMKLWHVESDSWVHIETPVSFPARTVGVASQNEFLILRSNFDIQLLDLTPFF
jgi:hypothetical protein